MFRSRLAALFLAFPLLLIAGCGGSTSTNSGSTAQLTLSTSSLAFGNVTVGQTSSAQILKVSNSGSAAISFTSITLTGDSSGAFAETTTCGSSLAAGSSCNVSVTFAPPSAGPYSATVTVTDSTGGSHTASATGTGATPAVQLLVFPQPDNSATPLYALVNGAQKTIDMTMYTLEDTTFSGDLVAACKRGVTVRVILDQNDEKSGNTPAFTQLNAQAGCSAVWANKAFEATHQKSIIVDAALSTAQVSIMSLNLQSQYYSTTRDFALLEHDAADIAAVEATFNADYAAGTTSGGTVGASDFSYVPNTGTDLIWSPTTAQAAMVNIIANAQKTLLIENEELANSASYIVTALTAACQRGVTVQFTMVDQSSYEGNFATIKAAGCGIHVYPDTTTGFYVHAKAVIADYGLTTQSVYMGSINYSNASMNDNRELGLYINDPTGVQSLYTTMLGDYNGAKPY